ncbi:hypothetical protein GOP47_0014422 [Adiantum capillus-veneris]|uniref:RING-type domain-containing protein n=1 Tax=Adiantum capillus-veneris TaxID=13818 RepID=A0A9D4UM08_ADICA|nr:hypothetical protein GOP47_0014422 [Adiantum capillus-veneris]
MAVQAQHPSLGDLRNKVTQVPGFDISTLDARSFLSPIPFQGNLLGECAMQQAVFMGGSPVENMQRLSQQGASPMPGLVLPNFPLYQAPLAPTDVDMAMGGSKKRRKESTYLSQNNVQKYQLQLGVDLNQASGCSPASFVPLPGLHNNVSTGLRLALDDERSTVTSSRLDSYSSPSLALKDELSTQLSQHQEELNQLIKAQAEHLRQALEERAQRQSKGLLAAVERGLSKRLREKEAEMERVTKRNMELEDTVKQLSMESQMWQSKAKNNEAMVAILRSNLQQAVLSQHQNNREQQSRLEGCGDSEVDDAASLYIDDNPHAQQMRAMASLRKTQFVTPSGIMKSTPQSSIMYDNEVAVMRACRRCKAKEASVVLLPCLHLCLCVACKDECERCPVCSSLKSANVEVFLS